MLCGGYVLIMITIHADFSLNFVFNMIGRIPLMAKQLLSCDLLPLKVF